MANQGKTSNRGFASMDPAKQRAIASKGGQSVPPEERSFSKDPELAASAGRKGGQASHGGSRAAQGQSAGASQNASRGANAGATSSGSEGSSGTGRQGGRSGASSEGGAR